jgi:signal transduction histidine kinase
MAHDVHDLTENLEEKIKSATKQLTSKNQELETSNARLKELDKFRSDFLAMLSHDIKGPLASILGFAQTLESIDLPEEKKLKYLRIIQTESKQLTSLVGGMLDISKMESKTFPLEFGAIDLPEMLTEALSGFQEQSSMEIEKHVPAGLSPVWGDKQMLLRVVGNILDNAKKYCDDQGKVELSATETDEGTLIRIRDSGPGIPEEDREKVFDKFYRSRHALAHKKKGSGLGLAIVKAVIDAHGGSVWCESGAGQGATFGFCLPKGPL